MLTQNTTQVVTVDGDEYYDVHFQPAGSYGGWLIDVWIAYDDYDYAIVWDATGTCLNGVENSGENVRTAQ